VGFFGGSLGLTAAANHRNLGHLFRVAVLGSVLDILLVKPSADPCPSQEAKEHLLLKPGSAIKRMPACVVDRGSIRRPGDPK